MIKIANDILSHVQNIEDKEDAHEFVRLYLLSLTDISDDDKKAIVAEVAEVDIRFNDYEKEAIV